MKRVEYRPHFALTKDTHSIVHHEGEICFFCVYLEKNDCMINIFNCMISSTNFHKCSWTYGMAHLHMLDFALVGRDPPPYVADSGRRWYAGALIGRRRRPRGGRALFRGVAGSHMEWSAMNLGSIFGLCPLRGRLRDAVAENGRVVGTMWVLDRLWV